jgi:hypothetical protein
MSTLLKNNLCTLNINYPERKIGFFNDFYLKNLLCYSNRNNINIDENIATFDLLNIYTTFSIIPVDELNQYFTLELSNKNPIIFNFN